MTQGASNWLNNSFKGKVVVITLANGKTESGTVKSCDDNVFELTDAKGNPLCIIFTAHIAMITEATAHGGIHV